MKVFELFKDGVDKNIEVKITDLENFFNVYTDNNEKYFYNLNSTIYFNFASDQCEFYDVKNPMHWSTISYNIYGTIKLAWLLMKLNNVKSDKMFSIVQAGTQVKYVDKDTLQKILKEIGSYG